MNDRVTSSASALDWRSAESKCPSAATFHFLHPAEDCQGPAFARRQSRVQLNASQCNTGKRIVDDLFPAIQSSLPLFGWRAIPFGTRAAIDDVPAIDVDQHQGADRCVDGCGVHDQLQFLWLAVLVQE